MGKPGMELQSFADPLGRIVHLAVLAGAEVEDIEATVGLVDRLQHGVDTVLHIKVGFLLMAIAQNMQGRGVLREPVDEVVDVSMRVALAENRNETENESANLEALRVAGNKTLAGELGSAVERRL